MPSSVVGEVSRYVSIGFTGGDDWAVTWGNPRKLPKAALYLRWHVSVFGWTLTGHFSPTCREDCEAEGWRVWGAVSGMLMAHADRLPEKIVAKLREL